MNRTRTKKCDTSAKQPRITSLAIRLNKALYAGFHRGLFSKEAIETLSKYATAVGLMETFDDLPEVSWNEIKIAVRSLERNLPKLKPDHGLSLLGIPGVFSLFIGTNAFTVELAAHSHGLGFEIDDEARFWVSLDIGGRRRYAQVRSIGGESSDECIRRLSDELRANTHLHQPQQDVTQMQRGNKK